MNNLQEYKKNHLLPNGRTIEETENRINKTLERIYIDSWKKGVSVTYTDERCQGENYYISANMDGSEDLVFFDVKNRKYSVIERVAQEGKGKFAYLTKNLIVLVSA
ncbi:MAG: xenobiotic reductase B [Prevotellaceae bacterium]|jgi:hypothetical protein|nr:xenobiotic reductase B [Prevotellaceae bacterium]